MDMMSHYECTVLHCLQVVNMGIFLISSIQEEALSPQSQLSPVSVCSDSSGFSANSPPAKKAPKRTSQTTRGETAHLLLLHLYLYALSENQGKFCTTLWVCRILGCDQPIKEK